MAREQPGDREQELEAERAFMRYARRSMAAMRQAIEALSPQAANRVDKEILEAKLAQRAESLRDSGSTGARSCAGCVISACE